MYISTFDFYSSKGQRSTNEDFVYPLKPVPDNCLFLVCDGVGGQKSGDIASRLTGLSVFQYLTQCASENKLEIVEALEYAHSAVLRFADQFPENKGMSSTVALVHKFNNVFYAAWVGDSRIYHIRDGEVLFKSKDHSYWQWLKERGYLKDEGCKKEFKNVKNMILQAIGGENCIKPSVVELRDVQQGDHLILVTDGILEAHTEESFLSPFSTHQNIKEILQEIVGHCHQKSQDNFSAYILEVAE